MAAAIITLVFAILERTHAIRRHHLQMGSEQLAATAERQSAKPHSLQTICELVFDVFGLVWLLLLPHHPFLIMGPAAAFLKFGPIWHSFYLPIVFLTVGVILRLALTLARPTMDRVAALVTACAILPDSASSSTT